MPEVSVLVPIYNVERYLEQCLDSVRDQTFRDIEVICINDGSTDGSRDIIQRYLDADPRFRVIDKPNSGYGASMNRGLDAAQGDYIAILESDDIFELDAIEKLLGALKRADADVAKGNYTFYWSTPEERYELFVNVWPWLAGKTVELAEEQAPFFLVPSIWSAVYRRDLIVDNGIRFLETPGASYQDTAFAFKVWACAKRATFIADSVLNYRQDNEKSSVNSPGKVFCVCDEYAEMERFLLERPEKRAAYEGVKERIKYNTYVWNYERLADELKMDFLDRMSRELADGYARGDLDKNLFEPWEQADLELLMNDPLAFHEYHEKYWKVGEATSFDTFRRYLHLGGLPLVSKIAARKLGLDRIKLPFGSSEGSEAAAEPAEPAVLPVLDFELPPAEEGPYISVVVPVYNPGALLDECLDSLEAQTLANIEFVCVNDGSTDGSPEVLERRAAADPRYRVVDKPNGGVSSARNAGILAATAPIVTFLDADDWFEPEACEKILATMLATGADILTFGARVVPEEGADPWIVKHMQPENAEFEGFEPHLIIDLAATPYIRTALKRDFLLGNDLLFDETLDLGEDELFLVKAYTVSGKTVLLSDKIYVYRQNDSSKMHTIDGETREKYVKHLDVADRLFEHWNKTFSDDASVALAIKWSVDFAFYGMLLLPQPDRAEMMHAYAELLLKHWPRERLDRLQLSKMERKFVDIALDGVEVDDVRALALRLQTQVRNSGPAAAAVKAIRTLTR